MRCSYIYFAYAIGLIIFSWYGSLDQPNSPPQLPEMFRAAANSQIYDGAPDINAPSQPEK